METIKKNKLSTIDKTILDNFYLLVHTDPNLRLRASVSTYKVLLGLKKKKSFNEQLNYCIERLVTGLASSRAAARRGYATLLLAILKNNQVATDRLLTIAQQKFGNISNESTADNLLGYFLLITIIIESANYSRNKQNASNLEKMFKILLQLRHIKSYFDYSVSKLLSERYELFHPYLLANITPESLGSGIRISHGELLTLVLCNKRQPMREFIGLDSSAIESLSFCLTNDRLQRRPLHPVWIEYSKLLMALMPQNFETFYRKVFAPTFFKPNHNELASMGLELTASLLESTNDPNLIKILLSDYVIRLLILSQRSKSPLNKHCIEFFSSLSRLFEKNLKSVGDSEDGKVTEAEIGQFCIMNRLTTSPGSVAFDEDSKSNSINNLLNNCYPNVLIKYLDKLMAVLNKKFAPVEAERLHRVCARQISHIIRRPQMMEQHETAQKLARFLIVNSFFEKVSPQAKKPDFWTSNSICPAIEHLDLNTRAALKSAYHSVMDHITSSCSAVQRIENYRLIVDFADRLLGTVSLEPRQENANLKKVWPVYYSHLSQHDKLVKKNQDCKILYPISNLYLFYGLQILEYGLDCKVQLAELAQSSKDALKNDPSDGSWADVLTDQIIAILSATECSPWIRKLCVSIFGSLLPHISETSIDLICEALSTPPDEDNEDEEGDESDGMDTDSEESEDEPHDDEDEEEEIEEDEELAYDEDEESAKNELSMDKDEEDEEQMNVDDENHDDDKAAADDDDEDDDEEYLNDEQMMKLDTVLADMFKLNKIGNKKKRDISFQLRLLDLVKKILAKKRNDTEVVKKIMATLTPLADGTRKSPELRPIADKISSLLRKKK